MAPHTKIPARSWGKHINTGTVGVPVWTAIGGISEWGHSPTGNDADATTGDNGGWASHFKSSRGHEFTLTGLFKEDHETGDRDPGQEAVEALGNAIGVASLKQFKLTSPGGTTLVFMASATVTLGGGGLDDSTSWEAALVVDGSITVTPAP